MQFLPLSEIARVFGGVPPRSRSADGHRVHLVGVRALSREGSLDPDLLDDMLVGSLPSPELLLREADVLLTIRGNTPKCAIVQPSSLNRAYPSGNVAVVRAADEVVSPAYLWAYLLKVSRDEHHPILNRATTQQLSIRMHELQGLKVPLPPKRTQEAIGEAALAIRDAVLAERAALAAGERLFTGFLTEAFPQV